MNKRELIYSQQASDFIEGKAYANPRFFSTPRSDVSKVIIFGDWPKIEAAYKAMGVPVERFDAAMVNPLVSASPIPLASAEDAAKVVIPGDWEKLPWTKAEAEGALTLRSLAASVSPTPILNKAQASAAILAEIERRRAAPQEPQAQPADGTLSPPLDGDGSGQALAETPEEV